MKTAILVGGGSSVKEGIELGLWDKIKGLDVWSINFAFLTMPYLPKREVWVDVSFFKNNIDRLQLLYTQGVPCYAKLHPKYADIPEIHTYPTTRDANQTDKNLFIGRMGLSGFFALSLAVKEEYDIIYLLGYDFGATSNHTHYYQDRVQVQSTGVGHPELYRNSKGEVKDEVKDFEIFTKYKSQIYNVSIQSAIPYFAKITYQHMFERLANEPRN